MTSTNWGEPEVKKYSKIDNIESSILHPLFHQLLGDVNGKRVVDYGCGEGRLLEELAENEASVFGYDTSPAMIETARRRLSGKAELSVIESGKIPLPENSIDAVVSNLVFMMVPSQDEIKRIFQEINRVLVNGGTFAFSITHPAFAETKFTTYYNRFHEKLDYFDSGQPYQFVLLGKDGAEITNEHFQDHHYPLETYLNLVCDSGFTLRHINEVKVDGNKYPPYLMFKTSKF